jgi:hypothetical protein
MNVARAQLLRARLPAKAPLPTPYVAAGLAQSKQPPRPPKRQGIYWLTHKKRCWKHEFGIIAAPLVCEDWVREPDTKAVKIAPTVKRTKKISPLTKIAEQLPIKLPIVQRI